MFVYSCAGVWRYLTRSGLQPASFCIMPTKVALGAKEKVHGINRIVRHYLFFSLIIHHCQCRSKTANRFWVVAKFLGIWLTPIISLIAVLLSDRLQPDEYGRTEKKWGCVAPFIVSFLIIGTVIYVISFIFQSR